MHIRFTARLPEELHEWLKQKAAQDTRSLNGELIYLLRQLQEKEKQDDLSTE